MEDHVDVAVLGDVDPGEPLVVAEVRSGGALCVDLRERRQEAVVAPAVAVRRSDRTIVVHPRRANPVGAAVDRLEQEDVRVRARGGAEAVVGDHHVEVVREGASALVDGDVPVGVEPEAAVGQDLPVALLAPRRAVRPCRPRPWIVQVEDRRDQERSLERLAAVHRADHQVLVLVRRVAVDERNIEPTCDRVHRRHGALVELAPVPGAEDTERRGPADHLLGRPRAALVVGVAEVDRRAGRPELRPGDVEPVDADDRRVARDRSTRLGLEALRRDTCGPRPGRQPLLVVEGDVAVGDVVDVLVVDSPSRRRAGADHRARRTRRRRPLSRRR